ncbi:hypothetical protein O1W71_11970 [Microbacterium sp. H37-C3]|uniref:hypothetical protein n=1 Tax=Microbacterium sp. H37-C3 TaxID=3004354 RepID=UPI0022AFA0A1|nr:hypothetical protein [Microbacterium sp. H37-C3]MCZ4068387.1 hypothetical protein [Microbacterium sp. H37-C3]
MNVWDLLSSREFGLYSGILFTVLGAFAGVVAAWLAKQHDYAHIGSMMRAMVFVSAWFAFLSFGYTALREWQSTDAAYVGLALTASAVGITVAVIVAGIRGNRTRVRPISLGVDSNAWRAREVATGRGTPAPPTTTHSSDEVASQVDQRELFLITRSFAELGYTEGDQLSAALRKAAAEGLEPCPPKGVSEVEALIREGGALHRLLSRKQSPRGVLLVSKLEGSEFAGLPATWLCQRLVDGTDPRGAYRCEDGHLWAPDDRIAFLKRSD